MTTPGSCPATTTATNPPVCDAGAAGRCCCIPLPSSSLEPPVRLAHPQEIFPFYSRAGGSQKMVRPRLVLFGDSITEQSFRPGGWGAALADTYSRKADVVVRGYGGYNTRWALFLIHHIFPLDGLAPPLATTIFFGANDAALLGRTSERQHVPVSEYKNNLKTIVNHLKDCSSSVVIVLITPPPIDEEGRERFARDQYVSLTTKFTICLTWTIPILITPKVTLWTGCEEAT
ncbi:GDSL esterase/lipase At5g62930 isoform X4 [Miscanthus floridulus]|uniref:GDSL esterase/lipase At5g62930 isoform X4 n=1 Tax=Miscanthus floridulus TaxID=154761 RepID=UPI003458113B